MPSITQINYHILHFFFLFFFLSIFGDMSYMFEFTCTTEILRGKSANKLHQVRATFDIKHQPNRGINYNTKLNHPQIHSPPTSHACQEWMIKSLEQESSRLKRKERNWNYQPIRQRNQSPTNGKPKNPIAEETSESTDQENNPGRESIAHQARQKADVLTYVVSHTEQSELPLIEAKNRFEWVGIERESVCIPSCYLHPDGGSETHPRRPRPTFQCRHFLDTELSKIQRKQHKVFIF